jgi:hypothetical protein
VLSLLGVPSEPVLAPATPAGSAELAVDAVDVYLAGLAPGNSRSMPAALRMLARRTKGRPTPPTAVQWHLLTFRDSQALRSVALPAPTDTSPLSGA